MPPELQLLIEGLALRRPPPTVATVHRQAAEVARQQGWPVPGYAAVYDVVRGIDPAMATLAHACKPLAEKLLEPELDPPEPARARSSTPAAASPRPGRTSA
jgi:hypothetical protein